MIDQVLTALGIVMVPSGAGLKAFFSLRDRVQALESEQKSSAEIVLVKLDAIAEKIDLRCDALEHRVGRVERSMNGHLHKD